MRKIAIVTMMLLMVLFCLLGCGNGHSNSGRLEYSQHMDVDERNGGKKYAYRASNVDLVAVKFMKTNVFGGNSFFEKRAKGIFAVILVVVENRQDDAITVDANNFRLIDMETGVKYSVSPEGQMALNLQLRENNTMIVRLNPGLRMNMLLVFDVPESLPNKELGLLARGGFTGKEILMNLGTTQFRSM